MQPAEVLITDIFMPDTDGFEAIDAFRRQFPRTKIVVVSGGAQFTKRNYLPDAELAGADATLQKPFDMEALLGLLNPPRIRSHALALAAALHPAELLHCTAHTAPVSARAKPCAIAAL